MSGLMLFGLAVFFFVFGILPYWFKVHRRLGDILSFWALTFPNGASLQCSRYLFYCIQIFHSRLDLHLTRAGRHLPVPWVLHHTMYDDGRDVRNVVGVVRVDDRCIRQGPHTIQLE